MRAAAQTFLKKKTNKKYLTLHVRIGASEYVS